jgi:hypothetical protein
MKDISEDLSVFWADECTHVYVIEFSFEGGFFTDIDNDSNISGGMSLFGGNLAKWSMSTW